MYSADFTYHRAQSIADAHKLLAANPGAKFLAGGHSLIPLMKLRLAAPSAVIDIGRIAELRGIKRENQSIRIGALTTHAELSRSEDLKKSAQALAEAASIVGDPAVRNRGTIGGNVAHADPASDLPIVLVALEATMIAVGPNGERRIPASQFFTGIMATTLAEDEILSAVEVPIASSDRGSAYVKFGHPASRYAVLGAAACVTLSGGSVSAANVAIGGLVPFARRAGNVEAAIKGQKPGDAAISSAASAVNKDLGDDVNGDIFASAEYRKAIAPVYVKRALSEAVARASA